MCVCGRGGHSPPSPGHSLVNTKVRLHVHLYTKEVENMDAVLYPIAVP